MAFLYCQVSRLRPSQAAGLTYQTGRRQQRHGALARVEPEDRKTTRRDEMVLHATGYCHSASSGRCLRKETGRILQRQFLGVRDRRKKSRTNKIFCSQHDTLRCYSATNSVISQGLPFCACHAVLSTAIKGSKFGYSVVSLGHHWASCVMIVKGCQSEPKALTSVMRFDDNAQQHEMAGTRTSPELFWCTTEWELGS